MERDFMGLGSRDYNDDVKEEAVEECKELDFVAFLKASAVQWPFSSKVSVPPHFTAFKPTTEEKIAKAVPSSELQKVHNGLKGSPFRLPTYQDDKMFSIPNQAISASMSNAIFNSHYGGSVQNFAGVTMKQQSIGASPVLRPHPVYHSLGSVAGTAETRFNLKPSESPPQMTIFYGGMVNVFDNISPEKAQAILFLAGNVSAKVAQPRPQNQPHVSKQGGGIHLSPQLANMKPNSGLSSPISVSSHPIVQSCKDYTSKDEVMPIKPVAVLGTSVTRIDPPKMTASTTVIHSAVPQSRKASLARFLEKRKERVISSAPYNIGKI